MKAYIKTVCCGAIVGACLMQLTNMAVESLINKHFAVGGEKIGRASCRERV